MKRIIMLAVLAAVTVAFTGCQKKETPGAKLDKAIESSKKTTDKAAKDADKAGADLNKKLDNALKK